MNTSYEERSKFSQRLIESLKRSGYHYGPTSVTKHFNARFQGKPVTIHAVRKWLVGEAIPTQDKIQILCDWLCITPDWLRFGRNQTDELVDRKNEGFSVNDAVLISNVRKLDKNDREIVEQLVNNMILKRGLNSRSNDDLSENAS